MKGDIFRDKLTEYDIYREKGGREEKKTERESWTAKERQRWKERGKLNIIIIQLIILNQKYLYVIRMM